MGDSGSQTLGFALGALGLTSSWRVAGTTVATLVLPVLVLAVPILDTTLVTVARLLDGRPIYQGGRDHSSHRLVRYGLSETARRRPPGTDLALHRRLEPRLHGARQRPLHDRRRRTHLRAARPVRELPRRRRPPPAAVGEPLGLAQAFAVHWRRLVEVMIDFVLITGSFLAAYAIEFGWPGTTDQRFIRDLTLPVILAARYLAFIPFGLYRSVWRYAGARDAAERRRRGRRLRARRALVHGR